MLLIKLFKKNQLTLDLFIFLELVFKNKFIFRIVTGFGLQQIAEYDLLFKKKSNIIHNYKSKISDLQLILMISIRNLFHY